MTVYTSSDVYTSYLETTYGSLTRHRRAAESCRQLNMRHTDPQSCYFTCKVESHESKFESKKFTSCRSCLLTDPISDLLRQQSCKTLMCIYLRTLK